MRPHAVVLERLARVEVKDEEGRAPLINDEFVLFMAQGEVLVIGSHQLKDALPAVHQLIELAKLPISQVLVT